MAVAQHVVIVDDDDIHNKVVELILTINGYRCTTCKNKKEAFDLIYERDVCNLLILGDLHTCDTFLVFRELRSRGYRGPVIFLTRRSSLEERLEAFDLGCDDYIIKPFEPREVIARVRAVASRFQRGDRQTIGVEVTVGDAVLYVSNLTYRSNVVSTPVLLTPMEMRVLECLMRNGRMILPTELLKERVWGETFEGLGDKLVVYIARIRRKIERDRHNPTYLHTIRGMGYVFDPNLER